MTMGDGVNRRGFLKAMSGAGVMSTLPAAAFGLHAAAANNIIHEVAAPGRNAEGTPKDSIRFSVCGMSHDHIYGMVGAILRGGGVLVGAYGAEPDKAAGFAKAFPQAKMAQSEEEILNDPSTQLVLSSTIPNRRAPLGVEVMKRGKDFLSDKPGATTLNDLAEVRKTIAETKRIYAIMYSELLEVKGAVKAGELVKAGAIGRVIQTINVAPHQIFQPVKNGSDPHAGGASQRPDWFWEPELYGGILCDIGSHQVDQFLYYTGSTEAEVVASQIANVNHPEHPRFQDFGDMMLRGNRGFGYVRLDWFTPDALGTWGDGRLFILGTEGYIEVRKYINVGVSKSGNNLFLVNKSEQRYIDCNNIVLPFGPEFVSDVANRTHTAQDQAECLLAAELVIKAQTKAQIVHLES
jgi:predicted dehydrogenase